MAAPYLIVGFDTEYVAAERVGAREGENTVLSYQYYALNPETGQGVGGIIYPRGGTGTSACHFRALFANL